MRQPALANSAMGWFSRLPFGMPSLSGVLRRAVMGAASGRGAPSCVRLLVDVLRIEHPLLRGLPGLAVEAPEEAAAVALVAGGTAVLHDLEDHGVAIAVGQ